MSTVTIANTDANLTGATLVDAASTQTITGAKSFNRSPNPPFAVQAASAKVTNLNADQVDGTDVTVASGNRVLYSSSTTAVGELGALTNGQLVIGSTGAAPVPASLTAGAGISTTVGAGSLTVAASNVVLLKANSGTDTSAGATNVDTIAITGLTAKDRLLILTELTSVTQNTAQMSVYSSTDSTVLVNLTPSPLVAGDASAVLNQTILGQRQSGATAYFGITQGMLGTPARNDFILFTTPATAWTGSWTLALRHGGVVGGGTLRWAWQVFKLAGQ